MDFPSSMREFGPNALFYEIKEAFHRNGPDWRPVHHVRLVAREMGNG